MKRTGGRGDAADIVSHALTLALFLSNIGFVVLHIFRRLKWQTLPDKALNLSLYQYSLLGRQMEHVINLLNSPVIGKKSSFSFVLLLTGLGITTSSHR